MSRSVLYPVDLTHQLGKVLKSQGLREFCLKVRVDLEDQGVRAYGVGCTCKRKNHPSLSLRFQPKVGYSLPLDSPRNQVVLRFAAAGSTTRNDIQVQPLTSGPKGREADEIRVGCRLELPESAGELTLASADPMLQPNLDYQSLVQTQDRERMREAVRTCVRIFDLSLIHI